MKKVKLTKSYKLKPYSNQSKLEEVKYAASRYSIFLRHFTTQLFYNSHVRFYSTKGMGQLANKAQKEAMGIVSGVKQASKATGNKLSCPQLTQSSVPCVVNPNKHSSFDYWITVPSQFNNKVRVPVKSHKALNNSLKQGWNLSKHCEFYKDKNNNWYVQVFVTKEVEQSLPNNKSLGIDVGIAHSVARSDGYLGKNLKPIITKEKVSQAERQRQNKPKKKLIKTKIKQQLDIELKRAINVCKRSSSNLVVENPKILANLKVKGYLNKWARGYFANRAIIKASEESIYLQRINPAYTSITCSKCGIIDKRSRVKQSTFICTSCGNMVNADFNASVNIALKGQERVTKLLDKNPVRVF